MECKNVAFVPTKVINQSVIFEDNTGRKFTMTGNSPKAVLSYYAAACDVNADDCMLLLNNFVAYDRTKKFVTSSAETHEVELQILKSNVNLPPGAGRRRLRGLRGAGPGDRLHPGPAL